MKKRIKKILIIVIPAILIVSSCFYNFKADSKAYVKLKNEGYRKGGMHFYKAYENISFKNPVVSIVAFLRKREFDKRFVDRKEDYGSNSSAVLQDISQIYRDYWIEDYMKPEDDKTDYNLRFVKKMGAYLVQNNLSDIPVDSIQGFKDIKNELSNAIKNEGAYCQMFFLNNTYDIIIWKSQKEKKYWVETPTTSREIPVIFYDEKILDNHGSFLSFGDQTTGGWPNNAKGVIYCNEEVYDIESEKFKYSYLTHEANHFFDYEKYPNLSAADLEYRSKLIELIYTKKDKDRILGQFLSGASQENRNHAHAYANFKLMHHFSKEIFNKPFEGNFSEWQTVSVEQINKIALELYNENEKILEENPQLKEII